MRLLSPSMAFGAALCIGFSGGALLAQDQSQPPAASQAPPSTGNAHHAPNPNREAKRMAKELGLTPEQGSKIEPILSDREQQTQSVRSDSTLAPKDRRAKLQGIRQDSDSRIEAILNDAQKQQYEQMKQEHKVRKQQGAAPSSN